MRGSWLNVLFLVTKDYKDVFSQSDVFLLSQETTPLAGSSAGAIVCVVVASGASMQEALDATKILAQDCRLKGTAFRLGVSVS